VKKTGNGVAVVCVYDAPGRSAAPYGSPPLGSQRDCTTSDLTAGPPGTPRPPTGSTPDSCMRQEFTGKERDYEPRIR
jgi:hypothetical protein